MEGDEKSKWGRDIREWGDDGENISLEYYDLRAQKNSYGLRGWDNIEA